MFKKIVKYLHEGSIQVKDTTLKDFFSNRYLSLLIFNKKNLNLRRKVINLSQLFV
jgi:hypothetical protein